VVPPPSAALFDRAARCRPRINGVTGASRFAKRRCIHDCAFRRWRTPVSEHRDRRDRRIMIGAKRRWFGFQFPV
jgi:hypothetical protein